MPQHHRAPFFWQTVLVAILFIASIGALLLNSVTAFWLPGRELAVRDQMREASLTLARAAVEVLDQLPPTFSEVSDADNVLLQSLSEKTLRNFPGVEGGFYIGNEHDTFAGFAHPAEEHPGPHPPHHRMRRDPPPRETPYIRLQAIQCAQSEDSSPLIQSRDVGPSRIVVATAAVGSRRPALLVAWLMYRVTGPEEQRMLAIRYQVSTLLALVGLIVGLLMTLSLRQQLHKGEESREQLREELRRSEHLASLGLMLAQVAHEARNPLAGIKSTAQLWQRFPEMSHSPDSLQALIDAVDRLNELLTKLLQFSRSDMSERSPVDLNRVIEETVALARAQASQQGVQVAMHLDPEIPTVLGAASALRQVVLNLTMNSLQAMPNGGRIEFLTRMNPVKGCVQMELEDNGPGIDPALRSRLFEPFFTTRAQGTGLGLALCREIVLRHGGTIELQPAEPHGTICRLSFPIQRNTPT